VTHPQSLTYCTTCHVESEAAPDGNAWNTGASTQACGSCHSDGLIVSNYDEVTGIAEYQFDHANSDVSALGPQNNNLCAQCHLEGGVNFAGPADVIHSRIAEFDEIDEGTGEAIYAPDQRYAQTLGEDFVLEILSATNTGPGETPVIQFRVSDAEGNPYDILNDPEFNSAATSLNLYTAWPGVEIYNGDTLGNSGGDQNRGAGNISYYGAGHPNRMRIAAIQEAIVNQGVTQAADGSYTIEYFTALPDSFDGNAAIALGGHPAAIDVVNQDGDVGNMESAPQSVIFYAEGTTAREFAVDNAKCNACHEQVQFHGGNRNGDMEMCLVCHNADLATESEGYALGYMIHSIHDDIANNTYDGGRYADITYPQSSANCDACHVEGSYNAARPEARSVSTSFGATEESWFDDIATTPTSASCGTCHGSAAAIGHFLSNNGQVNAQKDTILPVNGQEACAVCHGAGASFDTAIYHNPGIAE